MDLPCGRKYGDVSVTAFTLHIHAFMSTCFDEVRNIPLIWWGGIPHGIPCHTNCTTRSWDPEPQHTSRTWRNRSREAHLHLQKHDRKQKLCQSAPWFKLISKHHTAATSTATCWQTYMSVKHKYWRLEDELTTWPNTGVRHDVHAWMPHNNGQDYSLTTLVTHGSRCL